MAVLHPSPSALVDSLKALASQLIVLHHLMLYAPMADAIGSAWPDLFSFLVEDGRLAVQPFLVMGGFLAAGSIPRHARAGVMVSVGHRYLRLAPPFTLALLLVLLATVLMGQALAHEDWLSPLPRWEVFLAHVFFLQDVMGMEALSAGAWYVAIDLQLFALFVVLGRVFRHSRHGLADSAAPAVVALATLASVTVWSRNSELDIWAPYFLSAYGLGVLAAWGGQSARARRWWWATLALVLLDCLLDPRERPLWAGATALALHAAASVAWGGIPSGIQRPVQWLSRQSYSVFVCHFAAIILVSGLWVRLQWQGLGLAVVAVAATHALALGLGAAVQSLSDGLLARWRRP